jgi:GntR family transcriptional repressor for pyruvate dehydrogenase complex
MKIPNKLELQRAPKLSDQIADFFTTEIKKGTFAPGELLPSEAELSTQFGVSRTVIREALGKLKYYGLLESSQGSKTRVAEAGTQRVFHMDELEPVNLDEVGYLYEFRAILESEASALAAKRHQREDIENLNVLIEKLNNAVSMGLNGTNENVEFHKAIVGASKNPFIIDFMRFLSGKIFDLVQSDRIHSKHIGLPPDVQQEHINIFNAIKNGDETGARNATLMHISNAAKRRGLKIF